jgi:DNA polymerase-1
VVELFEILGIPTDIVEDGEEKHSVSASNIAKYEHEFPLVRDYLGFREQSKLVSTYGYNFIEQIHSITGRLHTSFKQIMNTGRLSSGGTDKKLGIKHLNFQNIPKDAETRSCFIPERGNVLVGCDYTAQEDLVFAQISQEQKLIEFYNDESGRDGHSFVAKMCFRELDNVDEKDVKKKFPDKRNAAKTAKFAIHYGGNGSTIARNLNIPVEDGVAVEMAYLEAFPGIAQYFKKVKAITISDGYVTFNPISRRKSYIFKFHEFRRLQKEINHLFWDRYKAQKQRLEAGLPNSYAEMKEKVSQYFKLRGLIERRALNFPIQGTSAEVTKISCIYIWDWIRQNGYMGQVLFVNTIHDENVLECKKEMGEEVAAALQDCMERAGAIYCKDVTLKAVPAISTHWEK